MGRRRLEGVAAQARGGFPCGKGADERRRMAAMIERLEAIVREAGEHMLAFQNPKTFVKEGHYNFVTEADLFVESFLIERIQPLAPGTCFYAEEQDNQALTDSPTWVIDPIDGTTNYMRGRGVSSISVALLEEKEPVLGMVYDPYKEELFLAEKGKGATRNGQAIHVSDTPFERALVCFGTSPYDASLARKTTSLLWPFLRDAGDLRRCGSAALDLCDLACGRSDVFFELKLSPWDFAAGGLIVQEAGGCFRQPDKPAPQYGTPSPILATNPLCLEAALAILNGEVE